MGVVTVSTDTLLRFAATVPMPEAHAASHHTPGAHFDLDAWIEKYRERIGVVSGPFDWSNGGKVWKISTCPWNADHTDNAAYIVRLPGGAIQAGCHHDGCKGHDWHALRDLIEPGWRDKSKTKDTNPPRSQVQQLIASVQQQDVQFFRTVLGDAYARIPVHGHHETVAVKSTRFRNYLILAFEAVYQKPPNNEALSSAIGMFAAKADYGDAVENVFVRIGHAADGTVIYVDLGDETHRAVEIDGDGWRLIDEPPVRFRRPLGMLPLPVPERGGSLNALARLINASTDDQKLIISWLIGAYHPEGPYPHLALNGEQGAGKSSTTRYLARLIDPRVVETQKQPRDEQNLLITAKHRRMIAYDNLSYCPAWLSDGLCRLSTGGGDAPRTLYTDDGETLFYEKRPVIMNGITELADRPDLAERTLVVNLERPTTYTPERELDATFEAERPRLLGAIFDGVSAALRNRASTSLERPPRMADFAEWVTAAEPALGWKRGTFVTLYGEAVKEGQKTIAENDPLGAILLQIFVHGEILTHNLGSNLTNILGADLPTVPWEGTAQSLLYLVRGVTKALTQSDANEQRQRLGQLPKDAAALSRRLKRLTPTLREFGLLIEPLKNVGANHSRGIRISRLSCVNSE